MTTSHLKKGAEATYEAAFRPISMMYLTMDNVQYHIDIIER
jgi:hypothetical protein